jgi:histidine triad (HIT) family protein
MNVGVNCVFCGIVNGEIPAKKVFEDEHTLAFLDIKPIVRGHVVVVPKRHYTDIFEISGDDMEYVASTAKKVAQALQAGLGAEGVNILHASGAAAQQSVLHFHLHLLPRKAGDGIDAFPLKRYTGRDLEEIAAAIRGGLTGGDR